MKRSLSAACFVFVATASFAAEPVRIELNALDAAGSKCRLTFVIDNKADVAVESLKLDLAVFNRDGGIQHRLITEMGPVRAAKTIVKAFEIDLDCARIGSVLVNDVAACAPGSPSECLDRLALASRTPARLFK